MICKHCEMLTTPMAGGCEFCGKYLAGFGCTTCWKVLKTKAGLTRHITTIHLREPNTLEYEANAYDLRRAKELAATKSEVNNAE